MDVINTQIFEKIQASDSLIPNTLFICLYNFIHALTPDLKCKIPGTAASFHLTWGPQAPPGSPSPPWGCPEK